VPGGPYSSTPLGIFAPTARNFAGSARNSLISWSSSTASSTPATSANVTCGDSLFTSFARDLPKLITRLPPPCMFDMRNQNSPMMMTNGSTSESRLAHHDVCGTSDVKPLAGSAAVTAAMMSTPCGAT